eukprot:g24084.t1
MGMNGKGFGPIEIVQNGVNGKGFGFIGIVYNGVNEKGFMSIGIEYNGNEWEGPGVCAMRQLVQSCSEYQMLGNCVKTLAPF